MAGTLKGLSLVAGGVVAGVLLSLNFSASAQRDAARTIPFEDLRAFSQVFEAIKQSYVEPVDDKKLISEAINGMLTGLDPHSAYLDQDSFRDLRVSTEGKFGGLGIEVNMEDGLVKVVTPYEDTPADRAGIKPGDFIVRIDDTPVKGMTLDDAVKRMRGKPKTSVTLTLSRKGADQLIVVKLVREEIRVQSVRSKLVEPGYGWLRIAQFQRPTVQDLVKHVNTLYKDGPLKGLVIDLRNDPGGVLDGAIGVSAAFLPPGTLVVSTDGRTPGAKQKYTGSPEYYASDAGADPLRALPPGIKTVPIVVLVNGGSASASEIVAGALQDHKRATVMGTQTFGKGSVQTVIPLDESRATGIKLTTARYYTPSGRSIQAKGIVPDILIDDPDQPRVRLREADLAKHLDNPQDKTARPAATDAPSVDKTDSTPAGGPGTPPARKPVEFGSANDVQLQQALRQLKGLPVAVAAKADTSISAANGTASTLGSTAAEGSTDTGK